MVWLYDMPASRPPSPGPPCWPCGAQVLIAFPPRRPDSKHLCSRRELLQLNLASDTTAPEIFSRTKTDRRLVYSRPSKSVLPICLQTGRQHKVQKPWSTLDLGDQDRERPINHTERAWGYLCVEGPRAWGNSGTIPSARNSSEGIRIEHKGT